MAKRERECEEFEEVSAVVHTSPNAKIHGVVTSLSPMKKAKSCSTHGKYSKLNRSSYLPPLDSPRVSLYTSLLPQSVTLCLLFLCLLRGSVALFALSCSGRSTPALLLHWHWHGRHYAPDRVASSCTSPGWLPLCSQHLSPMTSCFSLHHKGISPYGTRMHV